MTYDEFRDVMAAALVEKWIEEANERKDKPRSVVEALDRVTDPDILRAAAKDILNGVQ